MKNRELNALYHGVMIAGYNNGLSTEALIDFMAIALGTGDKLLRGETINFPNINVTLQEDNLSVIKVEKVLEEFGSGIYAEMVDEQSSIIPPPSFNPGVEA